MILDKVSNLRNYSNIPELDKILDFIKQNDLKTISVGKHIIDGDRLYAIVEDYFPRPLEECKFEAHEMYADLQLAIEGLENCRVAFMEDVGERLDSPRIGDVNFYLLKHNYFSEVVLRSGEFVFFPPNYIHMPGLGNINCFNKKIKKIVFKILM
ncbi:MAG: hypothetical protein A2504_02775 [Bdellovibrionales bacterium RIFOXYD12_FULL_39_22]|nr:MAG: hypothetical protein A2385_05490 [Bdellovibrionales bacterium RIFOXYB1_FULL_39_21]OFZ42210.1 MAG: hypothetical protein A2485_15520 [Bdellovibrionales bacterium RIFOXYC12_FULL_39_17]OFZ46698.1 MAG: hypothetical protein A2404_04150 [Bdellovibrionales bacterium RIFOXYC1_FULL_39_130]OFZ74231.1 MAG: hypothetical protein A2451_02180 [Bdellovibrionales bacterium RIFOXYC2_FULL_39_8]OFZ76025.1 MAG: hypothetical protein A2560_03000 [Bdellovibrionales bacterium RIFOXYD1_FULL_39_84]OFZ93009.1 MAG: